MYNIATKAAIYSLCNTLRRGEKEEKGGVAFIIY